jgi:superfamily II DNA/RNA helicase
MRVEVARPATTVATTTQLIVKSGREPHEKRDTLRRLIRSADGLKNAIIFCNRKRDVATLFRSLLRHGFSVQALHGDMDQPARMAALEQFRKGEVTLLVASDVAARGLDIPDVSHIYNFDVPHHPDDYVHRIGRTGRAGRSGTAIMIVAGATDAKAVAAIEKLIGQPIPAMEKPVGQPTAKHMSPQQHASERPHGHHHAGRKSPTARNEDARPRRAPPPAPRPRGEDSDASHLPAFLLRPVKV